LSELFFAEERALWKKRNRAGQIQKRRAGSPGLAGDNMITYVSVASGNSRDLIRLHSQFRLPNANGIILREEGWDEQILEHYPTGGW